MTQLLSPWTRLVIEPVANPAARLLAPLPRITPNRVTLVSLLLGLVAAACFATGHLQWGGAAFLLRYLVDCVDGKVARRQGTSSARGALLDISADVCGIHLAAAALSWHLVGSGHLPAASALGLLAAIGVYNWALAHRKHLAERAGEGDGGSDDTWGTGLPLAGGLLERCRRAGMTPVPWAVEAETLAWGLAPLTGDAALAAAALHVVLAFYVIADLVNLRRAWRIASHLDSPGHLPGTAKEEVMDTPDPLSPIHLPRVDVVIATRNRPQLLRTALDAVLAQDYPGPIHVMIVFDQCPVDESLPSSRGNRVVEVTSNHRSPGLAGARNSGIAAGVGEFVAFCDDDDVWLAGKVSKQIALLARSAAATAVTGIVVEYGDHAVPRVPTPRRMTVRELARRRVMEAHPSTVMVRRAALLDIGLVDESIPGGYGEDYDWMLRAAAHAEVAVVGEPLVRVRWGQSQFSRDWTTIIAAIDHALATNPVFADDPRALARLRGRRAFALAALGSPDALPAARETLRTSPLERRAYLAAAVAWNLVSAERLLDLAHRHGRGI